MSNKQGSSGEMFSLDEQQSVLKEIFDNDILKNIDWYMLPRPDDGEDFSNLMSVQYAVGFEIYKIMLEKGASKEQARLFLPAWASYYTWICKVDAHNLLNFLRLRMDGHAQYEIRAFADSIWHNIFKVALPATAEYAQEFLLKDIPNL